MPRARRPRKYGNTPDANFVKRIRRELGTNAEPMPQHVLASHVGVTQGAIGHIEQEARPLTTWLRNALLQLRASMRAVTYIAQFPSSLSSRDAFACDGQNLDSAEFLDHLPTCEKCLARSTVMRRIMPRP